MLISTLYKVITYILNRYRVCCDVLRLSVEWIQSFLQERNKKKQQNMKYPELMPLVTSTLGLQLAVEPLKSHFASFLGWLRAAACAAGLFSLLSVGIFLRADPVALQSLSRGLVRDAKTSQMAAALSVLGFGACVCVGISSTRCQQLLRPKRLARDP